MAYGSRDPRGRLPVVTGIVPGYHRPGFARFIPVTVDRLFRSFGSNVEWD
jgi:hypothetical protein